ncbi:hypothetical protein BC943DRAFT_302834 [Umbelopsis sp. AD052]|nr:hypothetical protein BC943DRAFT_302834 [Umbelopsis sp. AD052]
MVKVSVKWSGKKFDDLDLDTSESPELFKNQIYSLTGVPPERQKIMIKGGIMKDDSDLSKLNVKEGHTFMMMGTAGELPKAPPKPVVFLEDMSDKQLAQALDIPAGLENLGNTCYMNATLQSLRVMPELHTALNRYQGGITGMDARGNLTASLRDLYKQLSSTTEGFPPLIFWQMLRQAFPQFSQSGAGGMPMQQDAEECWGELISVLKSKLPADSASNQTFVEQYMTGRLTSELKCIEAPEEPPVIDTETFSKLDCHISISTNFMQNGIQDSLKQDIEKHSATLDRTAQYQKISKVSRLPQYLVVHFIRFFWKPSERVRAKILRKVKFPLDWDATELCTPELQNKYSKIKEKLREVDDKKLEQERERKKRKTQEDDVAEEKTEKTATASTSMDVDTSSQKVDWNEFIDQDLKNDAGANVTGQYELCSVLTHVGRSADSGHYISWVKKGGSEWLKYDDDKVSIVKEEDIQKLDGGGDWPMAYIVLYRAKKLD